MIQNKVGRPTVMNKETLEKLRQGFLMGFSDREACSYADINPQSLYNYQTDHPEYVEQKELWKQQPIFKAKMIVVAALERKDREMAKWYLERKNKEEFSPRSEFTGKDGEKLEGLIIIKDNDHKTQPVADKSMG